MRSFARHLAIVSVLSVTAPTLTAAQDEIYYASPFNGYRVYLSPAVHAPGDLEDECNGAIPNENVINYWIARDVGNYSQYYNDLYNPTSDGRNLVARGYDVRIGKGPDIQAHINNSNAWNAHLHIPIHSNADVRFPTSVQCARTTASLFGTHVIYRTGRPGSQPLADAIRWALGPASPGTDDLICYNPGHPCTQIDLGELRDPVAVPAYIESEFHTWNTGTDWLWNQFWWEWRVGVGVDQYLGYP